MMRSQTLLLMLAASCFVIAGCSKNPAAPKSIDLATTPRFALAWGSQGSGAGQFGYIGDVAADHAGNVYVVDDYYPRGGNVAGTGRVQKFTAMGALITSWGVDGTGDGVSTTGRTIAIDKQAHVYVGNPFNKNSAYPNTIQKFDSLGTQLLGTYGYGTGSGNGQFASVSHVAPDTSGHLFVSDPLNNRVQKFSNLGIFFRQWGTQGSGPGQFNQPRAIALNGAGTVIYVLDAQNNRIQMYKADTTAAFISEWGSAGGGNGQFANPGGIAVDPSGNVYVTDFGHDRVEKFDSTGNFISAWGTYGKGAGQFDGPIGIAADGKGNIYVADTNNRRIQKFTYQ